MIDKMVSNKTIIKRVRIGIWSTISLFFLLFNSLVMTSLFAAETPQNEITVTFKLDQVPLKEVVKSIQYQTGYSVEIEQELEDNLVSGDFVSIEVTAFLKRILKGQNVFVIQSPEEKTIVVKTIKSNNLASQTKHVEPKEKMVDSLTSTVIGDDVNEELLDGGIHELDNTFPVKEPTNNHHLIDPQTGLKWEEAEKLLNN